MIRFNRIAVIVIAVVLAIHQSARAQTEMDLPLDKLLSTKISTAAKHDQQMSEVPASVTIISSEEIQRYGWTSFDELMNAIRGLYITNDRNFSSLGVRGISRPTDYNDRLLVLLDGNPLTGTVLGESWIGNSLSIALNSIDRVEFVRGPGSALYGTGAMFGVLNVITRKANDLDGVSADVVIGSKDRHQAGVQFGKTFATGVAIAASANWNKTKGGDLYYPEFNAPESNNGVSRGLDFENFGAAMVTLTYGPLKVWGRTQLRQKGIPTASWGTTFNTLESTTNRSSIFGADYTKGVGSNKQFDFRTYWLRTSATGVYPYGVIGEERYGGLRYGGEGRFRWDFKANQRLIVGSELSRSPIAEYSYVVGAYGLAFKRPFSLASIYAQHEYQPFKKVSVVTGIRYDKYSHARGSTNPRLAIIVTPTGKTTFKLLYGSAFRIPSMYELEYDDPVYGQKKNEALSPERVRSLEAVVEQRLTRDTFLVFSAYKINATQLIDAVIDPADGLVQYQNAGAAKSQGFEVEMNMRRKEGLWAYGSYSYQQVTEGGQWMTNSPHHLIKAGVSTNPWAHFHGGLEVAHESGRRTLQSTTTNAATLVHGTGSMAIARDMRLILTVRNLFAVKYANPVGPEFTQAAIAQDGRTFTLSLSYRP
jgi:outer membrane receptor protein involved in Fe transport